MHAIFLLYGIKSKVDHLLMDMQSQKFKLKLWKGKKKKDIWVQGSVRVLPFGIYDYVFPEESADHVLTTLDFDKSDTRYKIPSVVMMGLRKFLKLDKIPDFDTKESLLWIRENVAVIPLGVKYDVITTEVGEMKGWQHEAL